MELKQMRSSDSGNDNVFGTFKGTPWPYQQEDSDIAYTKLRHMFGYETGLGKTFVSLYTACHFAALDKVIITGTKSALAAWLSEVPRWTDGTVNYLHSRQKNVLDLWKKAILGRDQGIWLLNHSMFTALMGKLSANELKKAHVDMLIEDEAHKSKNRKTQLYSAIKHLHHDVLLQATATPASRGAQDMYGHLSLLAPKEFTSYWAFVNEFCWVDETSFGKQIWGTRNGEELRRIIRPYYSSRKWKDVRPDMPPVRRQVIDIPLHTWQLKAYDEMLNRKVLEIKNEHLGQSDYVIAMNNLSRDTVLRKIALCPKIIDPSLEVGSNVEYILEELENSSTIHTVIFSQFKSVLAQLKQPLEQKGYPVFLLKGGMDPEEVSSTIKNWKQSQGIMLCTIGFAQSFALDTVEVAYVLGIDPDPINLIQMEGRLRRADSKLSTQGVLVRYLIPGGTREEEFKAIINEKVYNVQQFDTNFGVAEKVRPTNDP